MVPAFQSYKSSPSDSRGHSAPFLNRLPEIASAVHDQGWCNNFREQLCNVDVRYCLKIAGRALTGCGQSLVFVEGIRKFFGTIWEKLRSEHLANSRVICAPLETHQSGHSPLLVPRFGGAFAATQREPAIENEVGNPIGVPPRVGK